MPSWSFEQPRMVQGARLAPEGTLPIGGYALRTGLGVQVVHVFASNNPALSPPDAPHWVKTPIARRSLETSEGEVLQGWISGGTCGPLYGVIEEMARLHTPSFRETQVWPRHPGEERLGGAPDPAPSGIPVVIWGDGMDAFGRPSGMTLTGIGGEIGRFVLWSEAQLSDCWPSP